MNLDAKDAQFESLLKFLQQERGFDFTGYKRPSVMRRVTQRMQAAGVQSYEDYRDYLEVHPDEFVALFNTVLINVTSFFRDPQAWDYLREKVLPPMLEAKGKDGPVRIWSAGCASGEETCTLALCLIEQMGEEAFRERVKIYATDVDEEALNQARLAQYDAKALEAVPAGMRKRYFEPLAARWQFRGDLRRSVIFGRHDLVQDAPISRLDLLVCRNTLMYFNSETQGRVLSRFHFALNGDGRGNGVLFLGRAEMLLTHGNLFAPLELKCRIFAKLPSLTQRNGNGNAGNEIAVNGNGAAGNRNGDLAMNGDRLRDLALDESPVARIVVDPNGNLAHANQRARLLFSLNPKDAGRPLQDLEVSYRPVELRSLIEQAYAERRTIAMTSVERRFPNGETQYLDVAVSPLIGDGVHPLGASVTFIDVTRYSRLQEELRVSREEIQTTNEELQSANEELETTNEELQSSNEELETTNEELQSTNEELETMNEELQSTNEELQTVNVELRQITGALNQSNAFLNSVLTSLRAAAVVLDRNLEVLMWNEKAEEMWGLRAEEARRKSFLNLDIGLPVGELRSQIRACIQGDMTQREAVVEAINRRGRKFRCKVSFSPLRISEAEPEGAILLMEDAA